MFFIWSNKYRFKRTTYLKSNNEMNKQSYEKYNVLVHRSTLDPISMVISLATSRETSITKVFLTSLPQTCGLDRTHRTLTKVLYSSCCNSACLGIAVWCARMVVYVYLFLDEPQLEVYVIFCQGRNSQTFLYAWQDTFPCTSLSPLHKRDAHILTPSRA